MLHIFQRLFQKRKYSSSIPLNKIVISKSNMNTVKYLIIPTLFNKLKNIIRYNINIIKIYNMGCTVAAVLFIIYTFFINFIKFL